MRQADATRASACAWCVALGASPVLYRDARMCVFGQVEWYINFIRRMQPDSWSFEQVGHEKIRDLLDSHSSWISYHTFSFRNYGVPQNRKRILAGSPYLIEALWTDPNSQHKVARPLTTRDVLETMPRRACYVRASGGKKPPRESTVQQADGTYTNANSYYARSVDKVSWNVLCACKHVWLDEKFETIRVFTLREMCRLQTLPDDFKFTCAQGDAVRLVGNCVPPLIARKLMSCRPKI